jgi:hypothetical protein
MYEPFYNGMGKGVVTKKRYDRIDLLKIIQNYARILT